MSNTHTTLDPENVHQVSDIAPDIFLIEGSVVLSYPYYQQLVDQQMEAFVTHSVNDVSGELAPSFAVRTNLSEILDVLFDNHLIEQDANGDKSVYDVKAKPLFERAKEELAALVRELESAQFEEAPTTFSKGEVAIDDINWYQRI